MAMNANGTKLANLIDPQVVADFIDAKLTDAMRFAPLARIDRTLVGRPGSKISLPTYAYIGDASVVGEGEDIPIAKLTATPAEVAIHKFGRGVEITDESVLSGFGDPVGEAVDQLVTAVAAQLDNEVLGVLDAIAGNMLHTAAGAVLAGDDVADALVKFGEDIEGPKVLLVNPADYAAIRKGAGNDWLPASDIAADLIIKGAVGEIHGCQVVVSNKLTASNNAYIVKPGALAVYMKRDTMVETDRDIVAKTTVMTADKHCAAYLYDASKAVKIKKA